MSEAKITNDCTKLFRETKKNYKGFYYQKISDRFTSGIPDFYVLYRGQSAWLELKDEGEEPSPIQYWTIDRLNEGGAYAMWTDSFEDVKLLISAMVD